MQRLAIILILVAISYPLFSQVDKEYQFNCESAALDSIPVNTHYITYQVLSRTKTPHAINGQDIYAGELLLSDWSTFHREKKMITIEISKKHNIKELRIFRDCKARRIFYQAIRATPEQEKYLRENSFQIYEVD